MASCGSYELVAFSRGLAARAASKALGSVDRGGLGLWQRACSVSPWQARCQQYLLVGLALSRRRGRPLVNC
jgi:hypothetical protein